MGHGINERKEKKELHDWKVESLIQYFQTWCKDMSAEYLPFF